MSAPPLRYRWSALSIGSDVPLPLPPSRRDAIDLHLRVARISLPSNVRWYHTWEKGGRAYASFGRDHFVYVVRFEDVADVTIDLPRNVITLQPHGDLDEAIAIALAQALPLAAAGRGSLVLHASAVRCGAGAVLFAGPPGAGKSTLAAATSQRGCALLADDSVVFASGGRPAIFDTPSPLRLAPDAAALFSGPDETDARGKARVSMPRLAADEGTAFRVAAICVLDASANERITFQRLRGQQAAGALLPHAYRLDTEDRLALARELDQLTALAGQIEVSSLTGPRGLDRIGELAAAVARRFDAQPRAPRA